MQALLRSLLENLQMSDKTLIFAAQKRAYQFMLVLTSPEGRVCVGKIIVIK
jgi:hypothetical protein